MNNNINLEKIWEKYAKAYAYFNAKSLVNIHKLLTENFYGDIIDLGCGVGKILYQIKKYKSYLGVDSNLAMLNEAKKIFKNKKNVNFLIDDISNLDIKEKYFDCAVSSNVFYSFPNKKKVENSLISTLNLLKSNGIFSIGTLNYRLDQKKLEAKIIKECEILVVDKISENLFKTFIECNKILANNKPSNYKPVLYHEKEFEKVLKKVGFKEIKKIKEIFYDGIGFIYVCRKP